MATKPALPAESKFNPGAGSMLWGLGAVLGALLFRSFLPGEVLFSNDGPLGRLVSASHRLPDIFTGAWQDLNIVGLREGGAFPNITSALRLVLGPVLFAKFYAPLSLFLLGISAWYFFRRLKLAPAACLLGALAATLNSSFFSAACWGVASHALTIAMIFFAMAELTRSQAPRGWLHVALGGFAVGMAVSEGADIGALFSLFVALFIAYASWAERGASIRSGVKGLGQLVLVALCAGLLAAQAVSVLVATQVQGIAAAQTPARSPKERWDWATQWSLPKRETLSLVVPGLFGYRMEGTNGGNYWGAAGRAPALDKYYAEGKLGPAPKGYKRFVGGGFYAGIVVVMLAFWAVLHGWLKNDTVFNQVQRRWIWFWSVTGFVSLLLAYGRFAPFYRFIYALPYFSTIRNPVKFLHILSFGLVVLFGYGVDGLWRMYFVRESVDSGTASSSRAHSKEPTVSRHMRVDRFWLWGCLGVWCLSIVAWVVYAAHGQDLQDYLQYMDFSDTAAQAIAAFSVRQVGWFVLFFVLGLVFMLLSFTGVFASKNARRGFWVLGILLVLDLGRANLPWIRYVNYPETYAGNAVLDLLRPEPWTHRVAVLPAWFEEPWFDQRFHLSASFAEIESHVRNYYDAEWLQHQFPYYNIQSLDIAQLPRLPTDLAAYQDAFDPHSPAELSVLLARQWELTNTRYLVGVAALERFLNTAVDPKLHRIRPVQRFDFVPKPGVLEPKTIDELDIMSMPQGRFALFEFSGALPRARLYSNWQVVTNDAANLKLLAAAEFAPEQKVLLSQPLEKLPVDSGTNGSPGTVEFQSYAPKKLALHAQNAAPAVLLLNDRFDPNWKAKVDGAPAQLLRCNFLMRGVYLAPGNHTVQFAFQPPVGALYVSFCGVGAALVLLGTLVGLDRRQVSHLSSETEAGHGNGVRNGKLRKLSAREAKA